MGGGPDGCWGVGDNVPGGAWVRSDGLGEEKEVGTETRGADEQDEWKSRDREMRSTCTTTGPERDCY